jgi:hypothetical protein
LSRLAAIRLISRADRPRDNARRRGDLLALQLALAVEELMQVPMSTTKSARCSDTRRWRSPRMFTIISSRIAERLLPTPLVRPSGVRTRRDDDGMMTNGGQFGGQINVM